MLDKLNKTNFEFGSNRVSARIFKRDPTLKNVKHNYDSRFQRRSGTSQMNLNQDTITQVRTIGQSTLLTNGHSGQLQSNMILLTKQR